MRLRILALFAALLLGGCGFHLRGQAGMPFASLYLNTHGSNSPFVVELRRALEANDVRLVNTAGQAEVVLDIPVEQSDRQILSLAGSGRVNEYQLRFRVSLRAYDNHGQEWVAAEEMEQHRDYSYSDAVILAKEAEETMLVQSMRNEMVQQIIRRLSRSKPQPR